MSKELPTTCKYGHPLSGENLRLKDRFATVYANSAKGNYIERECAECHRQHNRDYWARKGRYLRAKRKLGTVLKKENK